MIVLQAANDNANNPWFSFQFFTVPSQRELYLNNVVEQIELTVISVCLGLLLAFAISLFIRRFPRGEGATVGAMDAIYSMPSIALFSLLLPLTGLSLFGPIIGLTLYTQLILVRAFMDGFRSVPEDALDAATGMGYGPIRRLLTMELPLAFPVLISGIRMATASTIALIPLAFVLSHGGLGETLTLGYSNNLYRQQVVDALVGIVVLALLFDALILIIGRLSMPWQRHALEMAS